MANRKYIVTFRSASKHANTFVERQGSDSDIVYGNACAEFGFMNVSGVYVDNEYNRALMKTKGFKQVACDKGD